MAQAYCMRCRREVDMKHAKHFTVKNRPLATQGTCSDCGSRVFRVGKA